jgi:hypothetical protein
MVQVQNTTFDNLAEGIAVFAANRRLKLWNNRFRTLWNLTPTSWPSGRWWKCWRAS